MKYVTDRCPVCKTKVNMKGRKSLCTHLIWRVKHQAWEVREKKGKGERAQGQKYAINPVWRRRPKPIATKRKDK